MTDRMSKERELGSHAAVARHDEKISKGISKLFALLHEAQGDRDGYAGALELARRGCSEALHAAAELVHRVEILEQTHAELEDALDLVEMAVMDAERERDEQREAVIAIINDAERERDEQREAVIAIINKWGDSPTVKDKRLFDELSRALSPPSQSPATQTRSPRR